MRGLFSFLGFAAAVFILVLAVRAHGDEPSGDKIMKMQKKSRETVSQLMKAHKPTKADPSRCSHLVLERFGGEDFEFPCDCLEECFNAVSNEEENEVCLNIEDKCYRK